MTKACMKRTCTATATLTLTNNSDQISRTAIMVQYVFPANGVARADLDADALALCR